MLSIFDPIASIVVASESTPWKTSACPSMLPLADFNVWSDGRL